MARLLFQAAFHAWDRPPQWDAAQYDHIAWRLAQGATYVGPDGYLSHRAPGFPFLLAGVYSIFGHAWTAGLVLQALLGAGTAALMLAVEPHRLPSHVRLIAAALFAVFPFSVYWSGALLSEPLCTFLTVVAMAAWSRSRDGLGGAATWGMACAAATLTRPNMGLLFLLALPWLGLRERRVRTVAVAIAAFGLMLVPWTLRNLAVHHAVVPVTTMGGEVLWESNNPHLFEEEAMLGRASHAPDLPEAGQVRGLPEVAEDQAYLRLALRFAHDRWRDLPVLLWWKMARFWNPFPMLPSPAQSVAASLSIIPLLLFAAAGLVMAWRHGERWLTAVLLPIVAVTLTALVYWGDARIRSPSEPSLMILAAYALDDLRRRVARSGA